MKEQKESCLPTMSRTRDLLITADITVRRSKPTELRGEYFKAKSCLLDGNFDKSSIYIGVFVLEFAYFGLRRAELQEWGRSGSCSQSADC